MENRAPCGTRPSLPETWRKFPHPESSVDPAPCSLLPYPLGLPHEFQDGHEKCLLRDPELCLLSGTRREPSARPEQCPPEREGEPRGGSVSLRDPERSWRGRRALSPPARTRRVVWLHLNQTASAGRGFPGLPRACYPLHRPKCRGCRFFSPRAPGNIPIPEKGGFAEKVIRPLLPGMPGC